MKKYEIIGELGRGGMGLVLRGRQRSLKRDVAIKVLPKQYSQNPQVKARFEAEIKTLASLSHPNVVGIIDRGEQDGTLYYVMDFVKGRSLEEILDGGKTLPPGRVIRIARDTLEALGYVHERGLVHRDIKPANIMIADEDGRCIVMDFGLVKALFHAGVTMQGQLVGTPRYMSPEMILGTGVDARSDLFQLGLVLYEALTGVTAFSGANRTAVLHNILKAPLVPARERKKGLPPGFEGLLSNALARNPDNRYGSAREMLEDVERIARGEAVEVLEGAAPEEVSPDDAGAAAGAVRALGGGQVPRTEAVAAGAGARGVPRATMRVKAGGTTLHPRDDATAKAVRRVLWGTIVMVLLAGTGAVLAALLLRSEPVVYSAMGVEVEEGFEGAEIRWKSEHAYPSKVEYGEAPSQLDRSASSEEATKDHRVELTGLREGRRYHFRILYPEGQRSTARSFRTRVLRLGDIEVRRLKAGGAELTFDTSLPTLCRVETKTEMPAGSIVSEDTTRTEHRLVVKGLSDSQSLEYRIVAEMEGGLVRTSEWMNLPSLLEMGADLARHLASLPSGRWIADLERAPSEQAKEARERTLEEAWEAHPAASLLEELGAAGGDLLKGGQAPLDLWVGLVEGLGKLEDLDQYARGRGLEFETGALETMKRLRSGQRRIRPREGDYAGGVIPGSHKFNPIPVWMRGSREMADQAASLFSSWVTYTGRMEIKDANELTGAEVGMEIRPRHRLNVWRIDVNGRILVSIRSPRNANPERYSWVFHDLDPRLLRDGENTFSFRCESLTLDRIRTGIFRRWAVNLGRR